MASPDQTPFAADAPCGSGYSITREFKGATVMITGGSGYIGSLLVEQLLRTTDVKRIYVLIRGKRGQSPSDRMQRILHSGLFHLVRDNHALLQKVHLLEGDLNSDNLGLSATDLQKALSEVEFVIHSAASIELEADVQHTLRSNYLGTRRLLQLASRMERLRCFLHVSTAYVNVNLPRGSSIEERIYPLKLGQQLIDHAEIVEDLLSLKPDDANVRAQMYLDMWDFPNTYTLGKNITEQLVSSFYKGGLPVAIVRPTLVCGLAGDPYPGYCGNLAGPIGMGVATAIGLFDCLESVAMVPTHVWDAVPGDVVTSAILAAAAATSAGLNINEYKDSRIGSNADPMIVHAGTSTTYPISFVEAAYAGNEFIKNNPPPFRLPGGNGLFKIPLDFRPDDKAVERCKYWTAWKVWFAVKLLETLGQHKTARRLKYGHMAWAIQNSSKTDRHLFFGSKHLRQLENLLDPMDADSGHYTITWTIKNGGWPRYIATNIAGMYKLVFGITNVKGLEHNDFKFIPAASVKPIKVQDDAADVDDTAAAADDQTRLRPRIAIPDHVAPQGSADGHDIIEAGLRSTASMFASIPASGASMGEVNGSPGAKHDFKPLEAYAEGSNSYQGSVPADSDNVGGVRAAITNKLGSSLSYRASFKANGAQAPLVPSASLKKTA